MRYAASPNSAVELRAWLTPPKLSKSGFRVQRCSVSGPRSSAARRRLLQLTHVHSTLKGNNDGCNDTTGHNRRTDPEGRHVRVDVGQVEIDVRGRLHT